jgi:hypothetical protein
VELGLVSGTFHFYVREEVIPEPSTSGEVRGHRQCAHTGPSGSGTHIHTHRRFTWFPLKLLAVLTCPPVTSAPLRLLLRCAHTQPLNPVTGMWILERVSIAVRVS